MQEDTFYIVLTIPGTQYEEVEVVVTDPLRTIREQIERIVRLFNLPKMDNYGNPVCYLLGRPEEDGDIEILEFEDFEGREWSLLDHNVCPGEHLQLLERPIAGGCPTKAEEAMASHSTAKRHVDCFSYEPKIRMGRSFFGLGVGFFGAGGYGRYVYSSVFAPAEIGFESHMLVQVYLHNYEETEKVKELAIESQPDAERRDYIPLQCKLRKGDTVDVILNIYGKKLLMSEKKSVVWQGSFTKCSFDYYVPHNCSVNDALSSMVLLMVNGIPVGEMKFITRLSFYPRKLNSNIASHNYKKVFISYAHKDESKVKSFHEGLKLCNIDHFFDRNYLKAGDVYPQVIQDYINSADLFVLFWSENASQSDYVEKERKQALKRAYPHVKPQKAARLTIYPMSIEPHAELPSDMKDYYHFGEL